ncbi:MAG: dicarboxylate/amino acid:cation symporter [Candidatus Melainabacteria bacterium]|nr:dicarboxylate/amino acid:cation symporter [Candidatus Melainabacteria bacterium]
MSEPKGKPSFSDLLPYLIFAGVVLGIVVGGVAPALGKELAFIGDMFMRALLMLVVPLVMTSIIVGISQLGDVRQLGGLARKTIIYFLSTTFMAACLGLVLVNAIQPGVGAGTGAVKAQKNFIEKKEIPQDRILLEEQEAIGKKDPEITQVFKEIVVGLIPKNLFKSMVNTDLLPIILFSLVFGAVITTIGERGETVILFFQGANDAIMKIVDLLMMVAPVGIFALIAGRLGEAGGLMEFADELMRLGKYASTVIAGLVIFAMLILPAVLFFLGKPKGGVINYFKNLWTALLTAFSTASSAAALPVTMESVIQAGVSKRNANFVLPLGTTLNMNGTALYEAVAAVFIAQISGIELTSVHMILIAVTASLAAVGAASIPEAGLVTMLIVLKAAGLPTENVSLILIIDWFLDRCRTAVNVWGDAVGAAVVDRFEPCVDMHESENQFAEQPV